MLRSRAGRLRQVALGRVCANIVLLSYTAAAWAHDTGGLHIHAPDLGGLKSSTGVFWAAVVAVLMFGFFGGCAVMLILDMIRERRERRELRRREEARRALAHSSNSAGRGRRPAKEP